VYHPERGFIIETTMTLNRMFILLAKIQLLTLFSNSNTKFKLSIALSVWSSELLTTLKLYNKSKWFMGGHNYNVPVYYAKIVWWANNIEIHFHEKVCGEYHNHFNFFM
jgi:hypothetical protein